MIPKSVNRHVLQYSLPLLFCLSHGAYFLQRSSDIPAGRLQQPSLLATVGLWVSGSNMRPWRGDCFSHLRYARYVSIASIICMATAPVFDSSFELFSPELHCSFSFSQSTITTAITTATVTNALSIPSSLGLA